MTAAEAIKKVLAGPGEHSCELCSMMSCSKDLEEAIFYEEHAEQLASALQVAIEAIDYYRLSYPNDTGRIALAEIDKCFEVIS